MFVARLFPLSLFVCALLLTTGCASHDGPTVPITAAPNASFLGGNWLLAGTMPAYFVLKTNTDTNLAMSFDVQGTKIVAAASLQGVCTAGGGFSINFQSNLSGTASADGTFTVSTPSSAGMPSLTVSGIAPSAAGGAWSGRFTYSDNTSTTPCVDSLSGAFTANAVGDIAGKYQGQGMLQLANGTSASSPAVGAAIGLTATLQQRASANLNENSDVALNGTIQTTGFSCFSTGTADPQGQNVVQGDEINTTFRMDDGSRLMALGVISNTVSSQLAFSFLIVEGGNCQGSYIFNANPIALSR